MQLPEQCSLLISFDASGLLIGTSDDEVRGKQGQTQLLRQIHAIQSRHSTKNRDMQQIIIIICPSRL